MEDARSAEEDGNRFVQRANERTGIDLETGVRWERLTTRDVPGVEFLHVMYPPGSESAPPMLSCGTTGRSSASSGKESSP